MWDYYCIHKDKDSHKIPYGKQKNEGTNTSARRLCARLCLRRLSHLQLVLQQVRHGLKQLPLLVEYSIRLVELLFHHGHTAREVAGRVRGILLRNVQDADSREDATNRHTNHGPTDW